MYLIFTHLADSTLTRIEPILSCTCSYKMTKGKMSESPKIRIAIGTGLSIRQLTRGGGRGEVVCAGFICESSILLRYVANGR